MKKLTKILALVLILVMAASWFTECVKDKAKMTDDGKVIVTIAAPGPSEKLDDDIYKAISDKFGIEIELEVVTLDSMAEKSRLRVASGSLPDLMFGDFTYRDYTSWGKQGLVKPLPEDYEEKYPNLAEGLKRTKIVDKLKKDSGGPLYGIPRSMSSIELYGYSSDTPNIDRHGFIYRKDWAEKLGFEHKIIRTYDEFIELATAFKKADLGGVGQENNMALSVPAYNAPFIFVHAANPNWDVFYKNEEGKYVSGYNDPETLDGIIAYKEAYDLGILHPTFYTQKPEDATSNFYSGKSGMYFAGLGAPDLQSYKQSFQNANPDINADEVLDIFWIEGKDGKVRAREMSNYWSCLYFRPDLDDETFHKILSMLDYIASPEGERLVTSGFEGKEYEVAEDGSLVNLIPQAEDGSYKKVSDIYPSADLFTNIKTVSNFNTNVKKENIETVRKFFEAKFASDLESKKLDLEMEFYNSDKYSKFVASHDKANIITEIIVGKEDPEKAWKAQVKSMQNKIDEITKEMNETIK